MKRLEGQVALVTGAAIAERLARDGAAVAMRRRPRLGTSPIGEGA